MDQDATWYGGRTRPRRLCVRWGPSSPSPKRKRNRPPQFSAHVHCGQTAGWIKMALGIEMALIQATLCWIGTQLLSSNTEAEPPPQFSAHFYCGQTAGCIKMPLCMEVGLGPDDIVLDGDQAPPPRKRGGAPSPNFWPMSIAAKRLDASGCHLVWR